MKSLILEPRPILSFLIAAAMSSGISPGAQAAQTRTETVVVEIDAIRSYCSDLTSFTKRVSLRTGIPIQLKNCGMAGNVFTGRIQRAEFQVETKDACKDDYVRVVTIDTPTSYPTMEVFNRLFADYSLGISYLGQSTRGTGLDNEGKVLVGIPRCQEL
jgi:hypothetical protein